MKTRAGRTHEVTKDMTPSKDCKSCRETCVAESRDVQRDCSSKKAVRSDGDGHISRVDENAKKDHRSCRRGILIRRCTQSEAA